MRRRLDLAAALVARPPILFLDEPTTGLDIRSRLRCGSRSRCSSPRGTTVLLTTQYLEEADRLAGRIAVINHGVVIAEGTPGELKEQVGGDRLEVRVTRGSDAAAAGEILARIADSAPAVLDGTVSVPIARRAARSPRPSAGSTRPGIEIDDIATQRPTLDDVFLELTGQTAAEAEEESR